MSWQESRDNTEDAIRAAIATGFFLLGASIVLGAVMEPGPALTVLSVLAPLTALLGGLHAFHSARERGDR